MHYSGAIDCDAHPPMLLRRSLLPYISDYWRASIEVRGIMDGHVIVTEHHCADQQRPSVLKMVFSATSARPPIKRDGIFADNTQKQMPAQIAMLTSDAATRFRGEVMNGTIQRSLGQFQIPVHRHRVDRHLIWNVRFPLHQCGPAAIGECIDPALDPHEPVVDIVEQNFRCIR